ncbi:hypothetical protein VTL71DRAFT_16235, partial [Oculimacula yallundae]
MKLSQFSGTYDTLDQTSGSGESPAGGVNSLILDGDRGKDSCRRTCGETSVTTSSPSALGAVPGLSKSERMRDILRLKGISAE